MLNVVFGAGGGVVRLRMQNILHSLNLGPGCWEVCRCQTPSGCASMAIGGGISSVYRDGVSLAGSCAVHLTLRPAKTELRPDAYAVLILYGQTAVPIPANLPFIPCHAANLYFMRVCGAGRTFFSSVKEKRKRLRSVRSQSYV